MKKCCRKCLDDLDIEMFSKDRKEPDGKRPYCKICDKKKLAKQKEQHWLKLIIG